MSTYQTHSPFLYVIGWSDLNAYYLGIRFANGCHPIDIWTTYFTSSKSVASFREDFGEPDICEILAIGSVDEIRSLECELINEFQLHTDPRWLNLGAFQTYCHSPADLDRLRELTKALWQDDDHRSMRLAAIRSSMDNADYREAQSRRSKQHWKDPDYREKHRASFSATVSDPEWRKRKSEQQTKAMADPDVRAKLSAALKGRKKSPEHLAKVAEANRRRAREHNANKNKAS